MRIDEEILRRILRAVLPLENPTTHSISRATGLCEQGVQQYLQIAECLGLAECHPA
jgi:hypothetical protein